MTGGTAAGKHELHCVGCTAHHGTNLIHMHAAASLHHRAVYITELQLVRFDEEFLS